MTYGLKYIYNYIYIILYNYNHIYFRPYVVPCFFLILAIEQTLNRLGARFSRNNNNNNINNNNITINNNINEKH